MVLKHEADPASFGRQPGACVCVLEHGSVDLDMSFVDAKQPRDDPEQGRLSRAVRSEHCDCDVGLDRQVAVEMESAELRTDLRAQRHRSAPSQRSRNATSTRTEMASSRSESVIAMPI